MNTTAYKIGSFLLVFASGVFAADTAPIQQYQTDLDKARDEASKQLKDTFAKNKAEALAEEKKKLRLQLQRLIHHRRNLLSRCGNKLWDPLAPAYRQSPKRLQHQRPPCNNKTAPYR